MFKSLKITNFRCFRDLEIPDLGRINLIAGKNNVGKTALLEAVWMIADPGNPALPTVLNRLRGLGLTDAEDRWGWLFCDKNWQQEASLEAVDEAGRKRGLLLALKERSGYAAPLFEPDSKESPEPLRTFVLSLTHVDNSRTPFRSSASLEADGTLKITPPSWVIAAIRHEFLGARTVFGEKEMSRFSELSEVGRLPELIEVLKTIDPRLRDLSLLRRGGNWLVSADVGRQRRIPVPLMGEGFGKLLVLTLAIANATGGLILIDEVENGLHYSILESFWHTVMQAARKYDVQIVATTHSWECIEAAHATLRGTNELRLLRLDRKDADIHAVVYDEEMLETVSRTDLEARG